ncbi:hypothetical protein [Xenophilus azovorans]|uniref:hypothetical protein n=1 Tax=Xenophilus azovorans TaxID=151755 RepID=UPI00056F9628|nr:hypothetical protein [Xenophilus azovorans]
MIEKTRAVVRKYGPQVTTAVMTLPLALAARAQATDPFDAAVDTITTKVEAYGGALVGLAAVAVVFLVGVKYVKKIPRAS